MEIEKLLIESGVDPDQAEKPRQWFSPSHGRKAPNEDFQDKRSLRRFSKFDLVIEIFSHKVYSVVYIYVSGYLIYFVVLPL